MWFWSIFLQIRSIFWLIIPILFAFQTSTFMSHRNIKLNMSQHKYIIAPWKTFSAFCITHISKFEDRSKQLIMLFMTPFHYSQLVMKFLMVSYIYLVFAHPSLLQSPNSDSHPSPLSNAVANKLVFLCPFFLTFQSILYTTARISFQKWNSEHVRPLFKNLKWNIII